MRSLQLYTKGTPAHTVRLGLRLHRKLEGSTNDLRLKEVRKPNGKIKCHALDTANASLNDILKFAKMNRVPLAASKKRSSNLAAAFLGQLHHAVMLLAGGSADTTVRMLNERAIRFKLDTDANPVGKEGDAPAGFCQQLEPFYHKAMAMELSSMQNQLNMLQNRLTTTPQHPVSTRHASSLSTALPPHSRRAVREALANTPGADLPCRNCNALGELIGEPHSHHRDCPGARPDEAGNYPNWHLECPACRHMGQGIVKHPLDSCANKAAYFRATKDIAAAAPNKGRRVHKGWR